MADIAPFYFEDFSAENMPPVFDLALNNSLPSKENDVLLSDIDLKLQRLLDNQMQTCLKAIKVFLAELAPSLTEEYGAKIISDFLCRRFPELSQNQNLHLYVNSENLSAVDEIIKKLSATDKFAGRIRIFEDNSLSKSDCRIIWDRGEELFSTSEILDKIRGRLQGVMKDD